MKVKDVIKELQKINSEFEVDIVDHESWSTTARAKNPNLKFEVNHVNRVCLIHYSLNDSPENMKNWFSNENIIERFKNFNPDIQLDKITFDEHNQAEIYFNDLSEPFDISEFKIGSKTRILLQELIDNL